MRRVVITGMGVLSPLGPDLASAWRGLLEGSSGLRRLEGPGYEGLPCRVGGPVVEPDFSSLRLLPAAKRAAKMDPFVRYAVSAALMAVADAGLSPGRFGAADSVGVVIGSGRGGFSSFSSRHPDGKGGRKKGKNPFLMPGSSHYMAAGMVAMAVGATGPSLGIATACASGTHAIGEAYRWIRNGEADIVIAGGSDAALCPEAVEGYSAARALSRFGGEPALACRPFDIDRDGFVLAEGAGVIVMESLDSARSRSAPILGEIIGYGRTTDARHETRPDPAGEAAAMCRALAEAGISPEEVGLINAHATSTPLGDLAEAEAIRMALGKHAGKIPVTANKSATGHMLGASGAVEIIFTVLSLLTGKIPPIATLRKKDPDIDLDLVTSLREKQDLRIAIKNSFGFGGANASLVLARPDDFSFSRPGLSYQIPGEGLSPR